MTAIYPVLGQVSPTTTTETSLYAVPALKYAIGSTLVLANVTHLTTEADVFVTVRVRPAGAAALTKHIIVPAIRIRARTAETLTIGMGLATTDLVTVQCSTADGLAATLFGTEI